ncbi:MAG TPA: helix-turn-helix domain-containing protein [Phenylobacterium sp.]|uniref:IclR family transcriptional regulator n=1 Tax=Phenylobacterium sp. TaxID=1871053 RepID=UPI002B4999DD|nr:helix-turn-helix domain-containing protein [Phenylobacterium sp.]HKR25141.1 helix-turn-helix domain-containing protein [Allosphingosinicella sp.]HKR87477.1 helix-turn-helix domain-containing protein [Phenylobacterium sp.]
MSTVKSAQRALAILELMEKLKRPARVSEIAKLLGYPQSSTSVLINSLLQLGYLNFNPTTHEFAPSIRVALVGGYLRFDGLHAFQVLDLLSAVRERTGATVILSSRQGVHVQYVYTLAAPGRRMLALRAGSLRPLTRAAGGVMLLTEVADEEIGRIVRRLNTLPDIGEREQPEAVLQTVRAARERGYATVLGRLVAEAGATAVKLPFRDSFGKALALSVHARPSELSAREAELVAVMREEIDVHCRSVGGAS